MAEKSVVRYDGQNKMIKKIYISNFKSLVDFQLPELSHTLNPFTCLVGLNGSGKSTVLQVLDFLHQMVQGHVSEWLKQRDWKPGDLTSRFETKKLIEFRLSFEFTDLPSLQWSGLFNLSHMKTLTEELTTKEPGQAERILFRLKAGDFLFRDENDQFFRPREFQTFEYEGSVLTFLNVKKLHPAIGKVKEFMKGLKSLELISPHLIRRQAKEADDVGSGGEKLSAFLHKLGHDGRARLLQDLQKFYPDVTSLELKSLRAGWKSLSLGEAYKDMNGKPLITNARHLNDGLLRLLTILAQTQTSHPFILFDEIENGINPELIPKLMDFLMNLPGRQVFVTTHSPMILNFIPDDLAQESVHFLYKDRKGRTKSIRFFDLEETREKLALLAPGEIFVDTNLTVLSKELAEHDG